MRNKLSERIKNAFLARFHSIGTVWNYLCLKTQDPDESDLQNNKIRQDVIENCSFVFG